MRRCHVEIIWENFRGQILCGETKGGSFSGPTTSSSGSRDAKPLPPTSEKSVGRVKHCDMSSWIISFRPSDRRLFASNRNSHKIPGKFEGQ